MKSDFTYSNPEFDQYATGYDAALARGLSVSGEEKEFFARGRIDWLAGCLRRLHEQPKSILDFGCGIGSATPLWFDTLGVEQTIGVDNSAASLEVARRNFEHLTAQFFLLDEYKPDGQLDLAFCNGVFHHIPPEGRTAALNYIHRSLRPNGLFSFWENNPWNPGTRYVMSRIPFDRDAITLSHHEAKRLIKSNGFEVLSVDFLFIFPRSLRWFRVVEPTFSMFPFGAQYQVLCRKS